MPSSVAVKASARLPACIRRRHAALAGPLADSFPTYNLAWSDPTSRSLQLSSQDCLNNPCLLCSWGHGSEAPGFVTVTLVVVLIPPAGVPKVAPLVPCMCSLPSKIQCLQELHTLQLPSCSQLHQLQCSGTRCLLHHQLSLCICCLLHRPCRYVHVACCVHPACCIHCTINT